MNGEERSVHGLVRSVGLTGGQAGYKYLVCALQLLREEPERLELVTKRLYPELARRFGVTDKTVEGALRRAAAVCLRREKARLGLTEPVTVKRFLARMAELDRAGLPVEL